MFSGYHFLVQNYDTFSGDLSSPTIFRSFLRTPRNKIHSNVVERSSVINIMMLLKIIDGSVSIVMNGQSRPRYFTACPPIRFPYFRDRTVRFTGLNRQKNVQNEGLVSITRSQTKQLSVYFIFFKWFLIISLSSESIFSTILLGETAPVSTEVGIGFRANIRPTAQWGD